MWHKSKSANNKSNGSIRTRCMRFDINVILTARAIVGVKFAAKSGSPLHRPVGRFSTTTHLRRATEWHRNFSFPPSLFPFVHRFYTVIDTRYESTGNLAQRFGSSERQRRPVESPLFLFGSLLALLPLEPGGENPLPPFLSPSSPSGTSSMENERDRFRMMAFTSVCRRQMSGVISRFLCHRGIFDIESTCIKINNYLHK